MNLHGGGLSDRSFIHIDDVASATLLVSLHAEPGSSWHISTKHAISIRNLVEKIFQLVDVSFDDIVEVSEERLGKDQNYLLDSSSLRNSLKWEDKISLEKGLSLTNKWIKDNLNLLSELPWDYTHKD